MAEDGSEVPRQILRRTPRKFGGTGLIRSFGLMKPARAIQCDGAKLAVGTSRRGSRDVLMLPTQSGKPLLPGPIALDMATAHRIGAELLRIAAGAEASLPLRAAPCGREVDAVVSLNGGKQLR
jgi:hypothetical protein